MLITPTSLDSTFKGFNTLFTRAKLAAETQSFWKRLAMQFNSTGESEIYAELEKMPRMREWLGERIFHNLAANAQTLVNRDFELSLEVDRNKISDDKLGIYAPKVEMMGMQAGKLPDDLIVEAMLAGTTSIVADGQYYYDTDHPVCPSKPALGTQRNYYASGKALNPTNYEAVRAEMMAVKSEDDKPMGIVPKLLVVDPTNEAMGKRIVLSDRDASGAANVNQGTAELLVIPELGATGAWHLFDTRWPVKPLIFQLREAVKFVAFDEPSSPEVFKRKVFQYGADGRAAAGYGPWQFAFLCKP